MNKNWTDSSKQPELTQPTGDVNRSSSLLVNRRQSNKSDRVNRNKSDNEEEAYLLEDSKSDGEYEAYNMPAANEFELRDRLRARSPKKTVRPYYDEAKSSNVTDHIIRAIEPGDTLQNLALKCGCSVSELKRANNLINEQEFYGLTRVKIPVKKYGILSEVLAQQLNSSNGHRCQDLLTGNDELVNKSTIELPQSSSINPSLVVNVGLKRTFEMDENKTDVKKFMQNLDKDLADIRMVTSNLPTPYTSSQPTQVELFSIEDTVPKTSSAYSCDGADCGLSLWHLLCLAAVILILIPVFFYEEELETGAKNHSHHHHHV